MSDLSSPERRIAGVLVPAFSLRNSDCLGIGDAVAMKLFIDWAAEVGFAVVKMLPINEAGADNSPYNAISSVALEPALLRVSPEALADLRPADYERLTASFQNRDGDRVSYNEVRPLKLAILDLAFHHFESSRGTKRWEAFEAFREENSQWIEAYSLFRVLMEANGSEQWDTWPDSQRDFSAAIKWLAELPANDKRKIETRRSFFCYIQWVAFQQWKDVKNHAASKGVRLMGDIPFGLNYYSADVWAQRHLFRTDMSGGTPPDKAFGHDHFVQKWGQNWGIPLYNWNVMASDGLKWWRQRVIKTKALFDLFRIDHILGFYRIYGFPWRPQANEHFLNMEETDVLAECGQLPGFQPRPDDTEENKQLSKEEGERYLSAILEEAGPGNVVGEDLGEIPDYVRPSLRSLGIAGYKVPQWEKLEDERLIPGSEYEHLSLATYATHDHDPLKAMWESLHQQDSDKARRTIAALLEFIGFDGDASSTMTEDLHLAFLQALFRSNSWLAVAMITDVFGRGERYNMPGTADAGNWTQRMHVPVEELVALPLSATIRELLSATNRARTSQTA